jgi:putative restriction endonuclease
MIEMSEMEVRISLFLWLKEREALHGNVFTYNELSNEFVFQNKRITLIGAKGIWFPKGFSMPISITTSSKGPYNDGFSEDGFLSYRYRGTDPNHRDNIGLKELYQKRIPFVYFRSIIPGKYNAVWPMFILNNNPNQLSIQAAIDPAYRMYGKVSDEHDAIFNEDEESIIGIRKYITTETRQRLHQTAFREIVLDAYSRQCTMCKLQHVELLDAAHIISDSDPRGEPIIQNGLSLCKIHHAAYDKNILGVSPDYQVKVRMDILDEVDGPMLKYGLQLLDGKQIVLPSHKKYYPDRDRLSDRYDRFLKIG